MGGEHSESSAQTLRGLFLKALFNKKQRPAKEDNSIEPIFKRQNSKDHSLTNLDITAWHRKYLHKEAQKYFLHK